MQYAYTVFGAGRQGIALAYDLALRGEAARVVLAEQDEAALQRAMQRLRELLPETRCDFEPRICDVAHAGEARAAMKGTNVAISATPYRFNALLAEAAVD